MSHATKSNRTPDGASTALCSGGLVSLRLTSEELRYMREMASHYGDTEYFNAVEKSLVKKIFAAGQGTRKRSGG
jgi:hypothetical protein